MNSEQVRMARHALGLPNDNHQSYRNHFCLYRDSDGYAAWEDLVAKGFATKYTGQKMDVFHLTAAGAKLVITGPEKLDTEDFGMM